MPFTPSHAVVALPFLRTPLVPAAIAVGAMTPDLPLFLRGTGLSYRFTHDAANIVWTTFLALGLFLLWRVLLRPAVRELSPSALARRLPPFWDRAAGAALQEAFGVGRPRFASLLLVISLMLGVLSHIFWDLFTHEGRAGVEWLPALDAMWGPLPGYKWLQYGSSVVGLVVLGVCGAMWLRRRPIAADVERVLPTWVRPVWVLSLPTLLIAAAVCGYAVFGPFTEEFTVRHLAYLLPPVCTLWGAFTVALCLLVTVLRSRRYQRAASAPKGRGGA